MLGWRLMNPYRLGHPVGEDREVGRIQSPRTVVMRRRWRGEVEEEYLDLWTSGERSVGGVRLRKHRPSPPTLETFGVHSVSASQEDPSLHKH
jgi:hypothetical protein